MRALLLLLLAETAALADATPPEKAGAAGPLVMFARVRRPFGPAPHCGNLAVETVVRFDVLRVLEGAFAGDTVDVGFQCVEFDNLHAGEVRRLTLTAKPRPTSFGWAMFDLRPADDRPRVLWSKEAKLVPGYSGDDDRCRSISLDDDGCPDPEDYTRADMPALLDQLVREPRLARFKLTGKRWRVTEVTGWLVAAGIPRGRFVQAGSDDGRGVQFVPVQP